MNSSTDDPESAISLSNLIDLMLGADIDAACRIETKQGLKPGSDPSCDHHLLLVTATQSAQFRPRTRVDLQALDGGGHAVTLAMATN